MLLGKERFLAARHNGPAPRRVVPDAVEETAPLDQPGQEELLQCLKALRMRLARKRDVPPYIIFSDKTLRAIARNRPTDPAALLRCPGVGDRKLEAYGGDFLTIIQEFCQTGGSAALLSTPAGEEEAPRGARRSLHRPASAEGVDRENSSQKSPREKNLRSPGCARGYFEGKSR